MSEQSLDRVHHIALPVADLESSVAWYTTSFHCEVIHRDRTQAILRFDNVRLVLVLPSQQRFHVAYTHQNAAEYGQLKNQAGGIRSTFVADPTGNQVELVATEATENAEPEAAS